MLKNYFKSLHYIKRRMYRLSLSVEDKRCLFRKLIVTPPMARVKYEHVIKASDIDPLISRNINIHSIISPFNSSVSISFFSRRSRLRLVFSEKNGSVISDSDIELREVTPTPSFLLFPLDSTRVSRSKHTQQRNHEILVQRVPDEPDVPVPHRP